MTLLSNKQIEKTSRSKTLLNQAHANTNTLVPETFTITLGSSPEAEHQIRATDHMSWIIIGL